MGDGSGLTAQAAVEVTVLSVNDPPQVLGVIPDQTLEAGDGPASLDLSPFFEDRDGDELSYTAVASDQAVALSLAGATLTLTVARPAGQTYSKSRSTRTGCCASSAARSNPPRTRRPKRWPGPPDPYFLSCPPISAGQSVRRAFT